jgi:hypothetical protein
MVNLAHIKQARHDFQLIPHIPHSLNELVLKLVLLTVVKLVVVAHSKTTSHRPAHAVASCTTILPLSHSAAAVRLVIDDRPVYDLIAVVPLAEGVENKFGQNYVVHFV